MFRGGRGEVLLVLCDYWEEKMSFWIGLKGLSYLA